MEFPNHSLFIFGIRKRSTAKNTSKRGNPSDGNFSDQAAGFDHKSEEPMIVLITEISAINKSVGTPIKIAIFPCASMRFASQRQYQSNSSSDPSCVLTWVRSIGDSGGDGDSRKDSVMLSHSLERCVHQWMRSCHFSSGLRRPSELTNSRYQLSTMGQAMRTSPDSSHTSSTQTHPTRSGLK